MNHRSEIGHSTKGIVWSMPEQEEKEMCNIPTINMIQTGQNIITLRVQAGLSVRDLQDVFGFSTPQAIYKRQHGTALPTVDNLVVLAAVFGVAIDDILVLDTNKKILFTA